MKTITLVQWQHFGKSSKHGADSSGYKINKNGSWDLHLSSMEHMLLRFHAYNYVNYAGHFTYCWAALNNLAEINAKMYAEFQEGNFAVKQTFGSSTCSLLIKLLSNQ